jgi:isocitrate dehydrogenase
LQDNEQTIMDELLAVEGKASDIGGYYKPDDNKASSAMRPSKTFNNIVNNI